MESDPGSPDEHKLSKKALIAGASVVASAAVGVSVLEIWRQIEKRARERLAEPDAETRPPDTDNPQQ